MGHLLAGVAEHLLADQLRHQQLLGLVAHRVGRVERRPGTFKSMRSCARRRAQACLAACFSFGGRFSLGGRGLPTYRARAWS